MDIKRYTLINSAHLLPVQAESVQIFAQPVGIITAFLPCTGRGEQAAAGRRQAGSPAALRNYARKLRSVKYIQIVRGLSQRFPQQLVIISRACCLTCPAFLLAHPFLQNMFLHNFAWKEMINGEELIIHRKGATPAGLGCLGVVPGSMFFNAFVICGKGNPASFYSCPHGVAGA